MLFRKLFQLLVVGGAVIGANSGCSSPARAEQRTDGKPDAGADGKASGAADTKGGGGGAADAGGGVPGW